MKIPKAHQTFAALLADTEKKSEQKIYEQLLVVLDDLSEQDLSLEPVQLIEEAIDSFLLVARDAKKLKRNSRRFIQLVSKILSLNAEGHCTALGIGLGVALGVSVASILRGTTGMPQSGTGLAVGLALIAGYIIGSRLDLDAAKKNRVLKPSLR